MNYFFGRLLRKIGLLEKINLVYRTRVSGAKVKVPVINGLGFNNVTVTEPWMCELLRLVIPLKEGTFIDVGVNTGQTLIKLKAVDRNIDYVGFEPNPSCVYYSEALIKANRYINCRLVPVGLLDKNAVLKMDLYSRNESDSSASLIENFRPGEKVYHSIFVPVSRFESMQRLLNISKIAVIKIDVESAELEVLRSMQDAIKLMRPSY